MSQHNPDAAAALMLAEQFRIAMDAMMRADFADRPRDMFPVGMAAGALFAGIQLGAVMTIEPLFEGPSNIDAVWHQLKSTFVQGVSLGRAHAGQVLGGSGAIQ